MELINHFCPVSTVKVRPNPKFNPTSKLAILSNKKSALYKSDPNSQHYRDAKKAVREEIKAIGKREIKNAVDAANHPTRWVPIMKRLAAHMSEKDISTYRLPCNVERQLTAIEECQEAAVYFSKISNNFAPLKVEELPDRVQNTLNYAPCTEHPELNDYQIYYYLLSHKVTTGVLGDLPPTIMKELLVELVRPVGIYWLQVRTYHPCTQDTIPNFT